MSLFKFFSNVTDFVEELPEIFPLSLRCDVFTRSDIISTYSKILTDTIERTHGIPDKLQPLLWDSCLQSENNEGLVTLLACAMTDMKDLFLVYVPSVQILRRADQEEEQKIREEYKKNGESSTGVYVSFKCYRRTEMFRIYSTFEHCVLASLNKTLNLSKAVQIKVNDLRASVSLNDSSVAQGQARAIATSLAAGRDVMLDAKDIVESAKPDTSSTEKAIGFLDAKKSFILSLPVSYISGLQTPGIGSTGEADMRAVERGLKQYFVSIVQRILKALFDLDTEFKSQDFREMSTALEVLKAFDLVSDENLSQDAKREILARVFDLDPEEEAKNLEAEAAQRAENTPQQTAPPALPPVPPVKGVTVGNPVPA